MRNIRVWVFATGLGFLASCASPGPIGLAPGIEVAQLASLPVPQSANAFEELRPQDSLRIEVFGVPDLTREVQVNPDGTIMFPLVGRLEATGLTPAELAQELEDRLRGAYVRDPEITVQAVERPGRMITVGGEVTAPARYPISGPTSLLEAVALGGGTTEYAELNDVLIFRTINGQRYIGVYDLGAIERGNYADPALYPEDIVMVGDSPNRRLLGSIAQITPILSTPIILLQTLAR